MITIWYLSEVVNPKFSKEPEGLKSSIPPVIKPYRARKIRKYDVFIRLMFFDKIGFTTQQEHEGIFGEIFH